MNEKKSVLIISYYFAPQNVIGAVRPTKIAKYLSRMGYAVTVICGQGMLEMKDPTLLKDMEELTDVHVAREWNPLRSYKAKEKGAGVKSLPEQGQGNVKVQEKRSLKGRARNSLYLLLCLLADRSFARRGYREICGMRRRFDVVLSSYGPISALQIAQKMKKKGLAKRWVADFRDVVEMPFAWQKGYTQRFLQSVRQQADCITGVSEGYLALMGLEGIVITNGFDKEDLPSRSLEVDEKKEQLTFMYCGQMYGVQRDMRPFFRVLKELAEEGVVAEEQITLGFAGKAPDAEAFITQASGCGLGARVQNYGLVPRDRAIQLQRSADAILIAAWNLPDSIGNLPGKLLEVLMMEKPVICCVAGNIPGSEAARLLRVTGAGCCYEEAEGERSYAELKAYVRGLCEAFSQGRSLPFEPNAEKLELYAYAGIAKRFSTLLEHNEFDG